MIFQRFIPHMHSRRDILSTYCFKHAEFDLHIKKNSHADIKEYHWHTFQVGIYSLQV
jgi:hypothetical protein